MNVSGRFASIRTARHEVALVYFVDCYKAQSTIGVGWSGKTIRGEDTHLKRHYGLLFLTNIFTMQKYTYYDTSVRYTKNKLYLSVG